MSALSRWRGFWFGPIDAEAVGMMRLTLGGLLIVSHLLMLPDLTILFSDAGVVTTDSLRASIREHRWSYYDDLSNPETILAVHLLGLVPLIGLTAGFQSQLMAVLALIVQVAIHHRAPWLQHGGDRILRMATLAMCLVPSGRALSVDAWLARRRGGPEACALTPLTAHRLIQIQFAVIYLMTGIYKLGGRSWLSGDALYYALSSRTFQRAPMLTDALLASPVVQVLLKGLTWLTLGWELAFAGMVLWRPTRRWALLIGVAVHVGIAASMMVGTFSFVMLWGYQAFLDPGWVRRLRATLRSRSRGTAAPPAR
ncbi:MAG: HTTM domain-containing protein [Myxococcota bacterium]